MAYYECVFIVRQDIPAKQVEVLAEGFAEIIRKEGGKVTKTEHWGLRNLAYRIKKNKKGHYVLFNIDAPSAAVAEMERKMRIDEDILRHLTVKVEELEDGPSIIMRREEREEGAARTGTSGDRERERPRRARNEKAADNSEDSAEGTTA